MLLSTPLRKASIVVGFAFLLDFGIDDVPAEVIATAASLSKLVDYDNDINDGSLMAKSLFNICFISYSTARLLVSDKAKKPIGSK